MGRLRDGRGDLREAVPVYHDEIPGFERNRNSRRLVEQRARAHVATSGRPVGGTEHHDRADLRVRWSGDFLAGGSASHRSAWAEEPGRHAGWTHPGCDPSRPDGDTHATD